MTSESSESSETPGPPEPAREPPRQEVDLVELTEHLQEAMLGDKQSTSKLIGHDMPLLLAEVAAWRRWASRVGPLGSHEQVD